MTSIRPSAARATAKINSFRPTQINTSKATNQLRNSMRLIVGLLLTRASLSSRALPSSCFVTPCPHADLYESRRRSPKQVFVLHQQHDDDGNGETSQMRRSFVAAAAAASLAATGTLVTPPAQAAQPRVKGAAEYDLEYYMRDLVKGNTKEGNLAASAPPPAPPSRTLQGPLLPLLLDNEYTDRCIPVKILSEISGKSPSSIAGLAKEYRDKSSKAFAAKAQWKIADVSDQYYFDLSAYALWRTAAELIPNYVKRDQFAKDVGRGVYLEASKAGLLKKKALQSSDDALLGPLTLTIPAIIEILDLYKSCGFITRYQLGGEDQTRRGKNVFDGLDDDDIASGSSVDCLVSIYEPAILSGALQITGEGSRFSPDYVGQTLSAAWGAAGILAKEETYFVDSMYRPNPKDFFPDERLVQFTLKKA